MDKKVSLNIEETINKARLWDIQGEIQKLQLEAQKLLKELEDD